MYNTGGDMISGKWINKNDGSIISIRNTVMDGDNIILITDKGELDMNSFSKNYIQVSDETYDNNGNVVSTNDKFDISEITPNYNETGVNTFDNETFNKLTKGIATTYQQNANSSIHIETTNTSDNFKLIDKVFSKVKHEPSINIDISWIDFPNDKVQMLMDTFDVDKNEISEYIYNKYLNKDIIIKYLSKYFTN